MNSAQLINQTSGDVEIYTPSNIIEAARACMGGIDIDPASSAKANERVKATRFCVAPEFTEIGVINGLPLRSYISNGGLDIDWRGRVWLNHPFGVSEKACGLDCQKERCKKRGWHTAGDLSGNEDWVQKSDVNYRIFDHNEDQAQCMITFASTSERWFQPLLRRPQCFLSPRTNYLLPDGTIYRGVTKGSVVTYFGADLLAFAAAFAHLGEIKVNLTP